jgi:tetratricopeptide (TPR) repeat protein
MTGRKAFASVAVAVGLALGWSASATATPKSPERAAADVRARELFQKGDAAYAEGRYEEAHQFFLEAYDLSGRPQLLYNVSNALERLGRYAEAIEALEKYLASGKARDPEIVQKRLANLKKRVEEQKKAEERAREEEKKHPPEEKPEPPQPAKVEQPTPTPPPPPESKPTPVAPILLLGASGAALATAGVFGVLTLSARGDVDAGCKEGPAGRLCDREAVPALDRDKTFGLVTDIALVSGVVFGGLGAYLLLTGGEKASAKVGSSADARPAKRTHTTRIEARPVGAGVLVVGTF